MPSEGFLFLSGGLGGGPCSRRVRPSVRERPRAFACVPEALCRWDWRGKVSRLARLVVVSRGRRGESWNVCARGAWWMCATCGRRGTSDACRRLGSRWARVAVVVNGVTCCVAGIRFAW